MQTPQLSGHLSLLTPLTLLIGIIASIGAFFRSAQNNDVSSELDVFLLLNINNTSASLQTGSFLLLGSDIKLYGKTNK